MGKNIDAYNEYLKKQEMLGVSTFDFEVKQDDLYIVRYIPNKESERLVKIPDFVCMACSDDSYLSPFEGVTQNLKIVVGQNLRYLEVGGYSGERISLRSSETSRLEDAEAMFTRCINLKEIDLSKLDTSKIVTMNMMFHECISLREIDLSNFNTSKVFNMDSMFSGCRRLEKINLSKFDTCQVKSMYRMFYGCTNLKELDLSSCITYRVRDMSYMFYMCGNLERLNIINFDISDVETKTEMFGGCDNLRLIITNNKIKQWLEKNREWIKLTEDCEIEVRQKTSRCW